MKKSFICLVLTEKTLKKNRDCINTYKDHIDMVELRADFLDPGELPLLPTFPSLSDVPVILTIRKEKDGGHYKGDEGKRREFLKNGVSGGYAFVDLEEDLRDEVFTRKIKAQGPRVIRSFHDFAGVPKDLVQRVKTLAHEPGEIPKAAVMPQSTADLHRLLKATEACGPMEKIILGMGSYGFPTRVLATPLGSFLTYCSVPGKSAAPGHIDPVTLTEMYRFRGITSGTALYGIIGNPVMHTFSPRIHNPGFARINMDALYLPFQVDSVDDFINLADYLNIRGFSVTIPHKEEIIRHLSHKDPTVEQVGACNTVARKESGWYGLNSDGIGFVEALKEKLRGRSLAGMRGTVIGAGGAAKAIVFALVSEGVEVFIISRTASRAEDLASSCGCAWAGLDSYGLSCMEKYSDLIVQTTSVGMEPNDDADPVPGYSFRGHELVYDIVYKPEMTVLLQRAQDAGCPIILGKEMLLGQAFVQFRLFTGREFPDKEGVRTYL
jgi:3-dehydroquinate dehydratase / shikimate dehydrogenase